MAVSIWHGRINWDFREYSFSKGVEALQLVVSWQGWSGGLGGDGHFILPIVPIARCHFFLL